MWYECKQHPRRPVRYPQGSLCPLCEPEFEKRQLAAALNPNWKDVIPIGYMLDFIATEHIYCRDEEHAFFSYTGKDANQKEKLRTEVLEKRAEFLELYTKIINEEQ